MPESPDFEKIAQAIYNGSLRGFVMTPATIAAQFRLVWNMRGAADLDAMETAHANYDWTQLEDALRSLDR